MSLKRRDFISLSAIAAATGVVAGISSCSSPSRPTENETTSDKLQPVTADVVPISVQEREARIAKAQRLLSEQKMGALILESGTSLEYFTGISWWPSERTMAAIIPANGDIKYVCPGFEEARFRELIKIGNEVHAWQEDESPYKLIADVLKMQAFSPALLQ